MNPRLPLVGPATLVAGRSEITVDNSGPSHGSRTRQRPANSNWFRILIQSAFITVHQRPVCVFGHPESQPLSGPNLLIPNTRLRAPASHHAILPT